MKDARPTFLSLYHAGVAKADDMDDFIDEWSDDPNPFSPKLHTYLGFTWEQWVRWGATGELPERTP